MKSGKPEWAVIIDMLEKLDIVLFNRIVRRMIYYLYTLNIPEITDLLEDLEKTIIKDKSDHVDSKLYSNMPNPKINRSSLKEFSNKVFQIAGDTIPDDEITEQVKIWVSQERSRFLSIEFENQNIALVDSKDVLARFLKIPKAELEMSPDDFINLRVLLIRRFLSSNLNYINIAKHHILVKDFFRIVQRTIGPAKGSGKLGGKSGGLILGHEILRNEIKNDPDLKDVDVPKSWYITSDTIINFIHYNALEETTSLKYLETAEIRAGYPYLQQLFKNSFFPQEIIIQLKNLLHEIGEKPIIVRSSSLLEDSFDAAFSGKYKSLFLANTGSDEKKLSSLLDAISEIYASIFGPDPIEYRKERGLIDFQEEMGILLQEVVGNRVGDYFFPTYSGVAFSNNEFRWSPRIEREDGVIRMVAGLGTRAVDRVADDYPFLASPGKPGLQVNVSYEDKIKYSQKKADVLNLRTNEFETIELKPLIKKYGDKIKKIEDIVSVDKDMNLSPPIGIMFDHSESDTVVTFQKLTDTPRFLKKMDKILKILSKAFKAPVDVEFACDGEKLYILQCRPQVRSNAEIAEAIPENIDDEDVIIRADRYITTGALKDIKYIVCVIPEEYNSLPTEEDMKKTAHIVSELNKKLPAKKFILAGPGRWGSRGDIKLGVQVTYSDIFNTAMLIELAYNKDGYTPELSFGTHFFQDMVESNIKYLPLYPDNKGTEFKCDKFKKLPNHLKDFFPDDRSMDKVIRVVSAEDMKKDSTITIIMNGDTDKALGFLEQKI